jgi:predicted acetyltransferase
VFVIEGERHKGYASAMLDLLLSLPELSGLRRILLGTRDAHPLYASRGFEPLHDPPLFMEILRP